MAFPKGFLLNFKILIIVIFLISLHSKNAINCASVDSSNNSSNSELGSTANSEEITADLSELDDSNDLIIQNDPTISDDTHHIIDLRKTKNRFVEINDTTSENNIEESIGNVNNSIENILVNFDDKLSESDSEIWTKFRWLMDLFDHHKFDSKTLDGLSKNCTDEMVVYLDALRRGETWAAKMYDASGRYNGEFFFGNNFWLGSKGLCKELQYNITPPFAQGINDQLLRTPPYATRFSTAVVRVKVGFYTPQARIILLGMCMPATCSSADITAILESDGKEAEMLANIKMASLDARNGGHNDNSSHYDDDGISVNILKVRPVPGPYDIWTDYKFYVVSGVTIFILLLITVATFFEVFVNYKNKQRILKKIQLNEDTDKNIENNNKIKIDCEAKKSVIDNKGHNRNDSGHNRNDNGLNRNDNGHNGNENGLVRSDVAAKGSNVGFYGKKSRGNGEEVISRGEGGPDLEKKKKCDKKYGSGVASQMLLCFSAFSNTGKIMNTSDAQGDSINCIHGLRFLSLGWVIMVHTYLQLFTVADNKTLRVITERNFFYQTVGNASYSVDTFFFISGLLLTYLYQKTLETKRKNLTKKYEKLRLEQTPSINHLVNQQTNGNRSKIQINQYAYVNDTMQHEHNIINGCYVSNNEQIHQLNKVMFQRQACSKEIKESIGEFLVLLFYRFVRLTPAYLFAIGLNLLATKYVYNNSVFEPFINEHINCDVYWWRNILYINNFFPGDEMCMKWSWYMANDTQFYIIGIFLMILSKKRAKLSLIIIGVLMVASWFTTGYMSISNNYRAKINLPFELFDTIYVKPWARLGPYLVGMLTGWYLWRRNGRIILPTWVLFVGWPCALALMAAIIYGMKDGYLDLWPTAFYSSIGHTAWSVAVAWVVICCVAHRGGIVSRILSYRGAFPLSRLAYCAYLVHLTIIIYTTFSSDGPMHLHNGIVLMMYAGLCVMSYLLSFVMSLGFEVPIVRLLKIMGSDKNKDV